MALIHICVLSPQYSTGANGSAFRGSASTGGVCVVLMSLPFLFFIGGKSAVLTGLTVGLGGTSVLTGRGKGLKYFIKEGETCVYKSFLVRLSFLLV